MVGLLSKQVILRTSLHNTQEEAFEAARYDAKIHGNNRSNHPRKRWKN